jgi:hypothetical protein
VEFMTGHLTNTSFTHQVEVFNMLPGALPNSSAIRTHAGQWVRIAHIHIKDVEDLIQHLGSLQLALPVVPLPRRRPSSKPYRTKPLPARDVIHVNTVDDPNEFTSHPFIYADEDHHLVEAQPLVATTKPPLLDGSGLSNATRAPHHLGPQGNGHWGGMCGRVGWIGDTLNTVHFVTSL